MAGVSGNPFHKRTYSRTNKCDAGYKQYYIINGAHTCEHYNHTCYNQQYRYDIVIEWSKIKCIGDDLILVEI